VLDALLDRFRRGDRLALSRLLSLLARGDQVGEILARVAPLQKPSRAVAITGSGGVGKSTLVGKSIEWLRQQHWTVAVLACDPQSPLSGGALLGDRFRMPNRPDDEGVFIRSLAAAGSQGAVAQHVGPMVRVLEAFGFDVILVETVGAGQSDTAVRDLVDVVVLLLQPETGDDLQWEKAGLLEVADIVVVHKADLPGAERVESQVRAALDLPGSRSVPVLRVSCKTDDGIERLWQTILEHPARRHSEATGGRELLRLAQETLASWLARAEAAGDPELHQLITRWQHGTLPPGEAASDLWRLLEAHQRECRPQAPR
jgi:LAO/AO transport system ATPase